MPKIAYEEQINALIKISKAVNSDNYLEDILRVVVNVTADMMGSNICSLMLLDDKNELVIRATQSISDEYNKKPPLKIGEGIAGKAVKEKRPIVVKNIAREKEYKHKEIAKKEGLCSLVCVPLEVRGKVIGVINCYTSTPQDFNNTQIDILTTVANQAALAIENSELSTKAKAIQEELEVRKKVERAKGILMKEEGLSEEQAYLKIQKYSMDSRKTMREVAEAIILSSDMRKEIDKTKGR